MKAPTIFLLDREQSFNGPAGLVLQLDATQIVAFNPLLGDVAIVHTPEGGAEDFDFARKFGGIYGVAFTAEQVRWLNEVQPAVEEWLAHHHDAAEETWRQENNTPTMYWSAKEARAE